MNDKPRKQYISPSDMTNEQVVEVFKKAATGKFQQKEIAKLMHMSQATVSRILRREIFANVAVPHDYLAKAGDLLHKSAPRRRKHAPKVGIGEALARFTLACYELAEAEEACLLAGVHKDVLDSILTTATGGEHL